MRMEPSRGFRGGDRYRSKKKKIKNVIKPLHLLSPVTREAS